jgi:hypothetical protein
LLLCGVILNENPRVYRKEVLCNLLNLIKRLLYGDVLGNIDISLDDLIGVGIGIEETRSLREKIQAPPIDGHVLAIRVTL